MRAQAGNALICIHPPHVPPLRRRTPGRLGVAAPQISALPMDARHGRAYRPPGIPGPGPSSNP